MRYLLVTLGLLAAGPAAAQDAQSVGQVPPALFRSTSSELVVVPVTVTDRGGRLVPGLPEDRFTVYDDGRRQHIRAFSNEDHPVSVALVIDNSGSMLTKMNEVTAAALAFARVSHPGDELFLVAFNDRVQDGLGGRSLTAADATALEAALRALRPEGQTALYDALLQGLSRLETGAHARRVLVLVSDGADNASQADLAAVMERARRSNVTIYAIGLFDPAARDRNPRVLARLAGATGGARFEPKSPGLLVQAVHRIAREIRESYTIGYEPPDRDGRFHRVDVRVTMHDGVSFGVRTRPGYVAAGAEP